MKEHFLIRKARKDFVKLRNQVQSLKGIITFKELCEYCNGFNYNGELFDCNFGVITATVHSNFTLYHCVDIWDDKHDCLFKSLYNMQGGYIDE